MPATALANGSNMLCVDRADELAAMRSQLALAKQGEAALCRITGSAGSGKSTLLRTFIASIDPAHYPAVIAWGHCDQRIGTSRPLAPWSEILQSFTGLSDIVVAEEKLRDSNRVVESIRSALRELAPDIIELLVPGVGLVIRSAKMIKRTTLRERLTTDYAQPEELTVSADKSQLQDQYIAIIQRVLEQTPLIIVMDDLDNSDVASLELLSRIIDKTRGSNILFLTALRDTHSETAAGATLDRIATTISANTIDLDTATVQHGDQFVAKYLHTQLSSVDAEFTAAFAQHTGGHPLFVVELLEHLLKRGWIQQREGNWQASPDMNWEDVPKKIETILAEQLQELDPELLDILQAGSIEGGQFSIEVVAAALEKNPLAVARALSRRAPKNLVTATGSLPIGQGRVNQFRFAHSLAQKRLYAMVNPVERVFLHQAVAANLESLAGDQAADIAAQLAYQFDQAELAGKAAGYYELAAARATATCSIDEASGQLERALALRGGELDQMRLKRQLARLKMMAGKVQASVQLYTESSLLAEAAGATELAEILADQAFALTRINDFETALDVAQRAETLARANHNKAGLLSALQTLAHIKSKRGHHRQALDYQTEAMTLAYELGNEHLIAPSLRKLGWYLKELGRYGEAREALEKSLAIQGHGLPNYSELAIAYNSLADLHINEENYPLARENLLLAIESWRKFDRNSDVAIGLSNLANLANREGLFAESLSYARQAYQLDVESLGDEHPEIAFSLSCEGEALLGLGDYKNAIATLSRAYELRKTHGAPRGNLGWSAWLLGRTLVESGADEARGRQLVDEALAILSALGAAAQSEVREIEKWLTGRSP
tara:strand:- start:27873 stop:30392 length:2520 start_codon:yes stop_codon:yes gene_type:complete